MAYVKILKVTRTPGKAIDYIIDPEKTNECEFVSGYNVEPEFADWEFDMTCDMAEHVRGDYSAVGGNNIKAYHLIHSYSPYDKIFPEKAHELGKQYANEVLGGKFEYVIATHVDKGCIHNHIIFNAMSFYDFKKFKTKPYETIRNLREISNRICSENGLYIIPANSTEKNTYTYPKDVPIREKLKALLDQAIQESDSFEDFADALKMLGVQIKSGKHIAYLHPDGKRAVRGYSIAGDYSKEKVEEKIRLKDIIKPQRSFCEEIEHLSKKTTLRDTKELANALLVINHERISSLDDFSIRENQIDQMIGDVRNKIITIEEKNKQYNIAAKFLIAYDETNSTYAEYQSLKGRKRERFYKNNKSAIDKYMLSVSQLEKMQVNTTVDPNKVVNLVKEQIRQAESLDSTVQELTDRYAAISMAEEIARRITETSKARTAEQEHPQPVPDRKKNDISL